MTKDSCPKIEKCPIFNGLLDAKYTSTYQSLYCLSGEEGRNKCKRFLITQRIGKCPDNLLPNSTKDIEEIIASMN